MIETFKAVRPPITFNIYNTNELSSHNLKKKGKSIFPTLCSSLKPESVHEAFPLHLNLSSQL